MFLFELVKTILIAVGWPILWALRVLWRFLRSGYSLSVLIDKKLTGLGKQVFREIQKYVHEEIKDIRDGLGNLKKIIEKTKKIKFNFPKIRVNLKSVKRNETRGQKRVSLKFLGLGVVMLLMTIGGLYFYDEILRDLPNINQIYNPPKMSTKIVDKNGGLLYKFYEEENRTWVSIDKIPRSLIQATIAIEDKDFYKHHGLSIKGIVVAMIHNLKKDDSEKLRGGSTITQQLIKNVFLTNEKSWKRKIKEAILTLLIENKLSKNEILERYFNQVSYGGEAYGVQEASFRYFRKNVWELDLGQATFLAGLPAAPTSYSPFGMNKDYAYARQREVIRQMVDARYINDKQMEELFSQKVEVRPEKKAILAPHFVFYVKDILEKKYGYVNLARQGLVVKTSLDLKTQEMTEKIVSEEMNKIKNLRISNGAGVVIDVKQGDILAMVGSKDYYSSEIDGKYNVTTALRQPGSSIKPINYLLALEKGASLLSIVDDSPISYQIPGQKPYIPQNYNGKYMGRVTLKTALASSLNIPSVKLLNQNGVNNMIDLAERMGITTWDDRSRFGLALALGGGEVKMTELAGAYSIFANMGEKIEINPILEIQNYLGEVVYRKQREKDLVVNEGYAFLINSILSDDLARAPIFGTNSKLKIPGKTVAVKTGTTNSLKDNWCIGWTPSYLVATWVGNNDSSPMSWVASGVTGATPIWNRLMREMIIDRPDEKWEIPAGVYKARACGKEEYFMNGTEKKVVCPPPPSPTPTPNP